MDSQELTLHANFTQNHYEDIDNKKDDINLVSRRLSMTPPRRHIPGQVALLTRRCFQGNYYLRPDDLINAVCAFETARASTRHGQVVHAVMAMSNHIHFVLTDTAARRSEFMRDAMREISRARNRNLNRRDTLWDSRPFGDTALLDRDAIERKIIYTLLNPVHAGLVERVEDWPGFKILPKHWGMTIRIKCPEGYYGRNTPEYIEFIPMPPPGYEHMTLEEVRAHFEKLIKDAEDEIARARSKDKKAVKGVEAVKKVDPFTRPKEQVPFRALSPRFASKNSETLRLAIQRYRDFVDEYQRQRLKWLKGKKVEFPCGTVQLRRRAPIRCQPPDPDEPGLFRITRKIA